MIHLPGFLRGKAEAFREPPPPHLSGLSVRLNKVHVYRLQALIAVSAYCAKCILVQLIAPT